MLQTVHDRYYREDEGLPIPAAIMGDVFKNIEAEQKCRDSAGWPWKGWP